MKRVMVISLAVVMVFAMFGVCTYNTVQAATKKNKIEVTNVTVSSSEVAVRIKITPKDKLNVMWGNPFSIERYENGSWVELTMKEEVAYDDMAYCMPLRKDGTIASTAYHTYYLTSAYDREDLQAGKYRICMSINFKEAARYAEFTIPEYTKVDLKKNTTIKVEKGTVVKLKIKSKKKIEWTSSNKKVATVSKKGVVTTKKTGKVKIKAKYGKKVLKCTIKVTKKKSKVEVADVINKDGNISLKVKYTNAGKKQLSYGRMFHIERYENGNWLNLNMKENIAFTMEAIMIPSEGVAYQTYSLSFAYDNKELIPGKYRICTSINLDEEARYAEFVIPQI